MMKNMQILHFRDFGRLPAERTGPRGRCTPLRVAAIVTIGTVARREAPRGGVQGPRAAAAARGELGPLGKWP